MTPIEQPGGAFPRVPSGVARYAMTPITPPPAYRLGRHRARKPFGRCYELAYKYLIDHDLDGLLLVHGTVGPTADMEARGIGVPAGHAWIEMSELGIVFEPSYQLFYECDDYYAGWMVRAIVSSSRQEAVARLAEYRHHGPWHGEPMFYEPAAARAALAVLLRGGSGILGEIGS